VDEELFRAGSYEDAASLLPELIRSERFVEFRTLTACGRLDAASQVSVGR
jgi:hypothetical protein